MKISIKNKKLIAKNSKFSIYYYHLVEKNGEELENYLVVKPNIDAFNDSGKMVTGVVIAPVVDNKIGLIRIYRPALDAFLYEFPHGLIESGETIGYSALRELVEETGLSVDSRDFHQLGFITPDPGIVAARIQCYAALNCQYSKPIQHELGLSGLIFKSELEIERMILSSEIEDAITISVWHKLKLNFNGM